MTTDADAHEAGWPAYFSNSPNPKDVRLNGDAPALRPVDVRLAREHFQVPKVQRRRRSVSKPVTRLDDGELENDSAGEGSDIPNTIRARSDASIIQEVGATDDEEEPGSNGSSRHRRGSSKLIIALQSKNVPNGTPEPEADTEPLTISDDEASVHDNINAAGEPTLADTTLATPCLKPQKRDRSISATPTNPFNKRIRSGSGASHQALVPPATIEGENYDDSAQLVQVSAGFVQQLANHVRNLSRQHEERRKSARFLQHHIHMQLEGYQPSLEAHRGAQDEFAASAARVENLRQENDKLLATRKTMDDAKDMWMEASPDHFKGMERDLQEKLAANESALQEAETGYDLAKVALEETEAAARPALEITNREMPKLQELKASAEKLGTHMEHTDFLLFMVQTGPLAVATIDKLLESKGVSLNELRAMIVEDAKPAEENGQQPDAPMA
ncbi:hypothetical protein IL306_007310 [Fusarium sp. DS 682]|nr:hypothetical protein IL306_007310 [Fusarium sp. DS 682]